MKKLILLTACMLVLFRVQAQTNSGKCGDNITWTLENRVLTISGTDRMYDYPDFITPWIQSKAEIEKVVVTEGVTYIGYCAFAGFYNVISVSLPETLVEIQAFGFADCRSLPSITLPEGLTTIDQSVFGACYSLNGIYCKGAPPIVTPAIFQLLDTANITLYVPFDLVEDYRIARPWKFFGTIGTLVTGVDVEEESVILSRRNKNRKLTAIVFPDDNPTDLAVNKNVKWSSSNENAVTVSQDGEVTAVAVGTSIITVTTEDGGFTDSCTVTVESIDGICGDNITWIFENGVLTITGSGEIPDYAMIYRPSIRTDAPWFYLNSSVKSIRIEGSITRIGTAAFAFLNTDSVSIPNSVTSIGEHAFYDCISLKHIQFPPNLKSISGNLLAFCKSLKSVVIPTGVTDIGEFSFHACDNLTSLVIPSGVKSIGQNAFRWCDMLNSITIHSPHPPAVDENIFSNVNLAGCTLTVTGQSYESSIAYKSAGPWKNFGTLQFPNIFFVNNFAIQKDSLSLHRDLTPTASLDYTVTPENATNKKIIWSSSNPKIATVDQTGNVTALFLGNVVISAVSEDGGFIDSCYVTVNGQKNANADLQHIEISHGTFEPSFDSQTMEYTVNVNAVSGSLSIEGIPASTHTTVTGNGTYPLDTIGRKIIEITVESEEATSKTYTLYVNIYASGSCGDGVNWELKNDTLTVTGIGQIASYDRYFDLFQHDIVANVPWFSWRNSIRHIAIKEGITEIGNNVFYRSSNLLSVELPQTLTSIGLSAFDDCRKLNSIFIPDSVTEIRYAFKDCVSLTSVNIPIGVRHIKSETFGNCRSLTHVTLPHPVPPTADNDAFAYVDISNTTLTVTCPDYESVAKYRSAEVWRNFGNFSFPSVRFVESININEDSLYLQRKESVQLTYSIFPENATMQNIIWSCSNPHLTTVDSAGHVTAIQPGISVIYAETEDGGFIDSCTVTVLKSDDLYLKSIEINQGTLAPSFDPVEMDYVLKLSSPESHIFVECVPNDFRTSVSGAGEYLLNGINEGKIYIVLEAEDSTLNTYTISLDVSSHGTCGSNLKWTLQNDTLSVLGNGVMDRFDESSSPWYAYRNYASVLVIGESVSSIRDYAFSDMVRLKLVNNLNPVPQEISRNVFTGINMDSIHLEVPKYSISEYRKDHVWKYFNLPEELETSTGIKEITAGNGDYEVYSVDGRRLSGIERGRVLILKYRNGKTEKILIK